MKSVTEQLYANQPPASSGSDGGTDAHTPAVLPPGWYHDPLTMGQQRYYNGSGWTSDTRVSMQQATAAAAPSEPDQGSMQARTKTTKNKSTTVKRRERESLAAANKFTILAIVLGAVAFFFMPLIVGAIAIGTGVLAVLAGERRASLGIKLAVVGMVLGLAISFALPYVSQLSALRL